MRRYRRKLRIGLALASKSTRRKVARLGGLARWRILRKKYPYLRYLKRKRKRR